LIQQSAGEVIVMLVLIIEDNVDDGIPLVEIFENEGMSSGATPKMLSGFVLSIEHVICILEQMQR
jgi:hypothetical protein